MLLLLTTALVRAADIPCPPGTGPAARTEGWRAWEGCARADGVWHGPVRVTEKDGSVWTGSLYDGLEHGPWVQTSPLGKKLAAGQFSAGQRVGDWLTYDERGDLRGSVDFSLGGTAGEEPPPPDTTGRAFVETTIEDEPLTVVATEHQLTAYDGADLSRVWATTLASPPVDFALADDWALVAEKDGHLTALDLLDGHVARVAVGTSLGTIAGVVDPSDEHPNVAVVADARGQVSAIDLATGERLWRGESFYNPIRGAAEGHSVYLTRAKKLFRVHAANGREEWMQKTDHLAADLVLGDDLYLLDHAGAVTAWDPKSGALRWKHDAVVAATDVRPEALRWVDGELVVRGRQEVVILAADGTELDRFEMPKGAKGDPDAYRGRMAVADEHGDLVLTSGESHRVPARGLLGFEVREHEVVVVDADGIEAIDPAEYELDGEAPVDADTIWDIRDEAATSVAGLPAALPMTARADTDVPGGRALYVDATQVAPGTIIRIDLGWTEDATTGAFEIAEGWGVDELPGEMTLALAQTWVPRVVKAWPSDAGVGPGNDETTAFFDRVIHCQEPAIRYEGTMLLDDGLRDFRLEGTIEVRPERNTFPWGDACLLHVATPHETFGVWSPPDAQSWVGLLLRGQEVAPSADGVLSGDASAHLQIDYMTPRQEGPVTFEADGPFDVALADGMLSVTGIHGGLQLATGEIHSLAESGSIDAWEVHHRWSVSTRVDGPGWIRVGTIAPPAPN